MSQFQPDGFLDNLPGKVVLLTGQHMTLLHVMKLINPQAVHTALEQHW
jgi:hypothetical protein